MHSNWSDGSLSLEDLIAVSRDLGYEYIAVTDHSKGLGIARGLNEKRISEQKKAIESLNRKLTGFLLLAGAEVNITKDGGPDIDEDMLKGLDIVIGSIHSGFKQSREQLTRRIVTAMRHPCISVIGHPTGRLIGQREAYDVDMDALLEASAETKTALEINA